MPRYYFHLHEGSEVIGDGEGCILYDAKAAHDHGLRIVRDLVAHEVRETGEVHLGRHIVVVDAAGNMIECMTFSEIIRIEPGL